MRLNTDKNKVMLITTKQKCAISDTNNPLLLKYKDIQLEVSSGDNILGIYIDENLKWDAHVRVVTKELLSYLWLLSRISICI